MSINYVIATCDIYSKNREMFDKESNMVLQKHMKILTQLLCNKNNNIKCITIMKPNTDGKNVYEDYYDIDEYIKKITSVGIKVVQEDCINYGSSYNQWINAYEKYPEYDYYILMEDDWVPHTECNNFDKLLINIYKEKIKKKGYLCAWVPNKFSIYKKHLCISVGILNNETFNIISKKNKRKDKTISQIHFSNLFINNKLQIEDYSEKGKKYMIPFWETKHGIIYEYSLYVSNNYLLVPIQLLERDKYPEYKINHEFISKYIEY